MGMKRLSAKLMEADHRWHDGPGCLMHVCPGCGGSTHVFYTVVPTSKGHKWQFNGDVNAPAFSPSMNISWPQMATRENGERYETGTRRCHYFLRRGNRPDEDPNKSYIEYLGDCTHNMAGQVVELPDYPSPLRVGEEMP